MINAAIVFTDDISSTTYVDGQDIDGINGWSADAGFLFNDAGGQGRFAVASDAARSASHSLSVPTGSNELVYTWVQRARRLGRFSNRTVFSANGTPLISVGSGAGNLVNGAAVSGYVELAVSPENTISTTTHQAYQFTLSINEATGVGQLRGSTLGQPEELYAAFISNLDVDSINSLSININDNAEYTENLEVVANVIPEPSSSFLCFLSGACCLLRRRRS